MFIAAEIRSGACRAGDRLFDYRVYMNPHALSPIVQREVIEILSIPDAHKMLAAREYSAVVSVKARDISDSAVAILQYYDWGERQLWICDLVRRCGLVPPPIVNPAYILFDVVEMIADEYELSGIFLVVDAGQPELIEQYSSYGFIEISTDEREIHMVRPVKLN